MAAPAGFVEVRAKGELGWLRADLAPLGLPAFWVALQPLPGAKGRGGVGRLRLGEVEAVVRPYRRGGALGRLLQDRYPGPQRACRELAALVALRDQGVPVVVPVAAVARRRGAFWQLRLATELQADAVPLPAFLGAEPGLRRFAAEAVGTLLRLAFAAGLRHPDLHVDNVLCAARGDKVRAVLVDLDRAVVRRPVDAAAQEAMLARLWRYVERHRARLPAAPSRSEALRALRSLGLDRAARHAAWRRVAAKVARALRRGWFGLGRRR